MSEHRKALEDIMRLCEQSRTYTRRTSTIHEVAMYALGMTKHQRQTRHIEVMERVGGQPAVDAYRARCEKRAAKLAAKEGVAP